MMIYGTDDRNINYLGLCYEGFIIISQVVYVKIMFVVIPKLSNNYDLINHVWLDFLVTAIPPRPDRNIPNEHMDVTVGVTVASCLERAEWYWGDISR